MGKSLAEYVEWLDQRKFRWPLPPRIVAPTATPYLKPLRGIRGVVWNVYGTLLRISEGELLHDSADALMRKIAFEKTIEEFSMWHAMTRKPGTPWEQLYFQYQNVLAEQRMGAAKQRGDVKEVDSLAIWRKLVGRLGQKEYPYDRAIYGDLDELSEKVAYFFHANLQGVEAAPAALPTLLAIAEAKLVQGVLADGQSFTPFQLLRTLDPVSKLLSLEQLFDVECLTLSVRLGARKPSRSLFRHCQQQFESRGISPEQILYVSTRLKDDLGVARQSGFRTALYAADKLSMRASPTEVRDPELRPDRLITDLAQLRDILDLG